MEPHLFVDATGRTWQVIDYKVVDGKKKRVAIGSWTAEGRAFVPDGWEGTVRLFPFGHVAYRFVESKVLEERVSALKSQAGASGSLRSPEPALRARASSLHAGISAQQRKGLESADSHRSMCQQSRWAAAVRRIAGASFDFARRSARRSKPGGGGAARCADG